MDISIQNTINFPWTNLTPIRIGCVPVSLPTPDKFVLIGNDETPLLRIDMFFCEEDDNLFCEGAFIDPSIFICFGNRVFCLSAKGDPLNKVLLDDFFVSLLPHGKHAYVASARSIFRFDSNGNLLWQSAPLGIDGVEIIRIADRGIICNAAEDPQNKWLRYIVDIDSGDILSKNSLKGPG